MSKIKFCEPRMTYSLKEDQLILNYVKKHKTSKFTDAFWQIMQARNTVPGRSWRSVCLRYKNLFQVNNHKNEEMKKKCCVKNKGLRKQKLNLDSTCSSSPKPELCNLNTNAASCPSFHNRKCKKSSEVVSGNVSNSCNVTKSNLFSNVKSRSKHPHQGSVQSNEKVSSSFGRHLLSANDISKNSIAKNPHVVPSFDICLKSILSKPLLKTTKKVLKWADGEKHTKDISVQVVPKSNAFTQTDPVEVIPLPNVSTSEKIPRQFRSTKDKFVRRRSNRLIQPSSK